MMNKIITSEGNVQFQTADGKIINVHPFHIYTVFNEDTVSFLLIAMPKSSGLAIFTSKAEDLEVDGTVYTIDELPNALSEAFAKAGAVARYEIVDELPTSGQSNTIYLVPKSEGIGYDEYIYVNGEWELIGDTDIELDRYVDKETFSGYTADTLVLINTVSGNVITESERAISAETALQTAIDNEVSARTADVEALSGAIDSVSSALTNEVSARISADTELDGKIEIVSGQVISESERAVSAETDLQTAINEEASARTADVEALSGAVDNVQDEVDILSAALEDETSARTDADSALTEAINAVDSKVDTLSGEVETMGDEAIVDAEYISSSTTIDFYNTSGDVVAQVDATDFIIDGMVDDVRIENGYLVIEFNTDSGKQDISIPLTDIFDPSNYYDKTAIDGIVSGINESIDTVSGDVITEASARTDADTALGNKIDGKVVELTQSEYDSLVDKDPLVMYIITDATEVDMNDYYTSAQTDSKIAEATSGKLDTSVFETYSGNVETALNSKLDATAYTPTDLSNYYTKDETSGKTEIATALNGKANTTDIYTYIDGRGIKVQSASGTRRKSINLNIPVYSGSAVAAVSCNNESGNGNGLNHISGVTSFGAGFMVKTKNQTEAAFGTNNTTNQVNGSGAWGAEYVSGNTLFSVGNGNNSHEHNALEIRQNGDIYITSGGTDASWYSKPMVKLQDALGQGGISSGEVQTMIDNSISGKVDTSDFETYSGAVDSRLAEDEEVTAAALNHLNDRLSEDEEVTAAGLNALNDKFDGLKLKKLTQAEYDALVTKDANTLYIVID